MWTGESGCFRIRWRSKIVSSPLPNNKPIWRQNVKSQSPPQSQLPPQSRALWRMLWRHLIEEEPWVLEGIQIPSAACGRANSIWIRYMWTRKFLTPERKHCRGKRANQKSYDPMDFWKAGRFTLIFKRRRLESRSSSWSTKSSFRLLSFFDLLEYKRNLDSLSARLFQLIWQSWYTQLSTLPFSQLKCSSTVNTSWCK